MQDRNLAFQRRARSSSSEQQLWRSVSR